METHTYTDYGYSDAIGYGVRAMRQGVVKNAQEFSGLPEGVSPYDILHLLKRGGRELGFTDTAIAHLEYLMRLTKEQDWKMGKRPIVYKTVTSMAQEIGISEKQINNREQILHELGALVWCDIGNFRRYGYRGENGHIIDAKGVDLSPLAALYEQLLESVKRKSVEGQLWRNARSKLSSLRRAIYNMLNEAVGKEAVLERVMEMRAAFTKLDTRISALVPLSVLQEKITQFLSFSNELTCIANSYDNHVDKCVETSDKTEEDFRQYNITIQPKSFYKKDTSNSNQQTDNENGGRFKIGDADCGQKDVALTKQKSYLPENHAIVRSALQIGELSARTQKNNITSYAGKPTMAGYITNPLPKTGVEHVNIRHAYNAASSRFKFFIDHQQTINWPALVLAAENTCQNLGIHKTAWQNACMSLGREAAAICVLIADRRKDDTKKPVRNAGGFLRGCINAAHEGKLRLELSIFGILNREWNQLDG